MTSTCILRGRSGTWRHRPSLCMAAVALGDIDVHSAWQAWHLWHWAGSGGAFGSHRSSLCVAGVALGDIDLHFAWQAWQLWHWTGSGGALGYFGRRGCLRGRRGTWRHRPSLCVAGVALMALDWLWWRLGYFGRRGCLRGRCGTWRHRPSLCVAGAALGDISLHFAWQAWHLETSTCVLRGRIGTWLLPLAFWWHTKLFHTTLSQIPFTHNFVTQAFHTQLCHTALSHTTLSHTTLSHTTLSHTTLSHTSLSHTALSPNLSCTISFPSCLSPLIFTSACDHWKKLICGVIRSFNFAALVLQIPSEKLFKPQKQPQIRSQKLFGALGLVKSHS